MITHGYKPSVTMTGAGPTRVIVPYVSGMLRLQTQTAVLEQWPDAWLYHLITGDDTGYTRLMLHEWIEDHTTIVVEQDVVPPPGTIRELGRCAADWCTVPYRINGRLESEALGFAKFSWQLKTAMPNVLRKAARNHGGRGAPTTWHNLDQVIASALKALGMRVHAHDEHEAIHLHDYTETSTHEA